MYSGWTRICRIAAAGFRSNLSQQLNQRIGSPRTPGVPSFLARNMSSSPSKAIMQSSNVLAPLGFVITKCTKDAADAEMTITKAHLQPFGLVHGGLYSLIAEELGSFAAAHHTVMYSPESDIRNIVGTSVIMHHVSSAHVGDVLHCSARPIHAGRKTQLWRIEIRKKIVSSNGLKLVSVGELAVANIYDDSKKTGHKYDSKL